MDLQSSEVKLLKKNLDSHWKYFKFFFPKLLNMVDLQATEKLETLFLAN